MISDLVRIASHIQTQEDQPAIIRRIVFQPFFFGAVISEMPRNRKGRKRRRSKGGEDPNKRHRGKPENQSQAQESINPENVVESQRVSQTLSQESEPIPSTSKALSPKSEPLLSSNEARTKVPHLPFDVLLSIFSFLDPIPDLCVLAQVCTRWADAAYSPKLWANVVASDALTRAETYEESKIAYRYICYDGGGAYQIRNPYGFKKAGHLRSKKKDELQGARKAIEVISRRAGSYLRSLDLHDCFPAYSYTDAKYQMRNEDLFKIATRCGESLEEMRISPSIHLSGPALVTFAEKCRKLRTLDMTGCKTLTVANLGDIVRACPQLEDISVSQCQIFRGQGLEEKLRPVRKTLKRIDISDTAIGKLFLRRLMFSYPALEEIKVDNCRYLYITEQPPNLGGLERPFFPSLTSLNMDKVSQFPLKWLVAICKACPQMRVLSANNIQPCLSIGKLFEGPLPPLQHLSLSGQPLSDDMWQSIFNKLGASLVQCDVSRNISLSCALRVNRNKRFSKLEELNISGTVATDEAVRQLLQIAPMLTFLDVTGCRSIRDRSFRRDPLSFRNKILEENKS